MSFQKYFSKLYEPEKKALMSLGFSAKKAEQIACKHIKDWYIEINKIINSEKNTTNLKY